MNHSNFSEDWLSCSNDSIYNVTNQSPIEYAKVMYGIMMPILVIITIISNSLIIVILTKPQMKTPTNLVLLWLAVADLLTLLFPAPWYFYMYTLHYYQVLPHGSVFCHTLRSMTDNFPVIFHNASIWLTILLAGQRYIYICHPTTARTTCTVPKVNRAILTIFVASFSVQLSRFFDTLSETVQCHSDPAGVEVPACRVYYASWLAPAARDTYFLCYYGFRILFINLIPCIALVILNLLLFLTIKKAQAKRKKLLKDNESSKRRRNDLGNSTTYMLIVVVSVFLMVEIPMAIVTLVHMLANLSIIQFEGDSHQHYLNITVLICNFIIMLSFPLNFAIYCVMSAQFRNTFFSLFGSFMSSNQTNETNENTATMAVVGDGISTPGVKQVAISKVPNKQNGTLP